MRKAGFTLLELVVVVAILSLVALIVIPRLPSTEGSRLENSARSLAAAIRLVSDRCVTTKVNYRLRLNLTDNSATVARVAADGSDAAPEDPMLSRRFIADGILIEDVITDRLGKLAEGEVVLHFGASGLAEYTLIHLKNSRGGQYTVRAYPSNGKVVALPGYLEGVE